MTRPSFFLRARGRWADSPPPSPRGLHRAAAVLAFIFSAACATVRPPAVQAAAVPVPEPPLGSSARLLAACTGTDASYCAGALVTLTDVEAQEGRLCSAPSEFSEIIRVAVAALKAAPPENDEPQQIVARALDEAYPCKARAPFESANLSPKTTASPIAANMAAKKSAEGEPR